jgi:enoyl-CoA hydratase
VTGDALVLTETRGPVDVVTVNRPAKRNALDLALVRELHRVFGGDVRGGVRAVVLTGAGGHFAAGADIAELERRGLDDALASINGALFRRIEEFPVPVIAAVEGYALGGGCELALACDLRVASETARFAQPEVGLGIVPGAGALYRLPRLIGMGAAKDLVYTGRRVAADEALRIGLVNRVVPAGRALAAALEIAETISDQGAAAVRLAKLALGAQARGTDYGSILERMAQGILFESEDKHRRMKDFLDRKGRPR